MKNYLITLCLILCLIFGCKTSVPNQKLPQCIEAKIEILKNKPVQNPPAQVWKWQNDSKTFYYVTSDCCDQYNYLFNDSCEIICAPDGGFTGKGDQKCPEFDSNPQKTLIWKDERK